MTRHQKRLAVPNSWPVARKEQTYTVKADAGPHGESGVPLLILLRDVLGYADSRKEARYALRQGSVLINGEPASDVERPVGMFDILGFEEREEFYRVFPDEGGRLSLTLIDEGAAGSKLGKVTGKRHVDDGRVQLALHDGRTLVTDREDIGGNDSIVIGNEDGEIIAHFPYEEGALVTAVRGSHAGEIGTVERIEVTPGSAPNDVIVSQDGGEGFETIAEYVVVIDENFVEDDPEESEPDDAVAEADPEGAQDDDQEVTEE